MASYSTPKSRWQGPATPRLDSRFPRPAVDAPLSHSRERHFFEGLPNEVVANRQFGVLESESVSGEAILDFMFWPSAKRRFGWYLEPSYEYNFGRGHEQSLGISGGLLIAVR